MEILNYALTLEYLEAGFYEAAIAKGTALVPAGAPAMAIKTIGDHETAHVAFLRTAIMGSGGTPVNKPNFDFTAGACAVAQFVNLGGHGIEKRFCLGIGCRRASCHHGHLT